MNESLKIAIIGDFNFTYNSHHATNLALEHSERFLEVEVSYYWIRLSEAVNMRAQSFSHYDGIWFAPGPFSNEFFLSGVLSASLSQHIPIFLTGETYKTFVELLIKQNNLNSSGEKLISDNLVSGNQFEPVKISPFSDELKKIYATHSNIELTSSRYSIYPQLLTNLTSGIITTEGYDQFDEPEVIKLCNHPFALATMFCPQISSTREMPHPLINTFIRSCVSNMKKAQETA